MSKNDERVLELKKQVENKKEEIAEKKCNFIPETNLVIGMNGNKVNLNVLNEDQLKNVLVQLNMYRLSAADLKINSFIVSGYTVDQWMNDVRNKLSEKELKREEKELKILEAKLDQLLSEDKKTELELDSIAALLG